MAPATRSLTVPFSVPAEVAFDYLADPRHRPEWQSSLKGVQLLDDGPAHLGQRWYDVTRVPGVRPLLETRVFDRPSTWAEAGSWRGFHATLTLLFEATAGGCDVAATFRVSSGGIAHRLGPVLTAAGAPAVRSDLGRAARLLATR